MRCARRWRPRPQRTPRRTRRSALPAPSPPRPLGYEAFWPWVTPPDGLSVARYVQSQYEYATRLAGSAHAERGAAQPGPLLHSPGARAASPASGSTRRWRSSSTPTRPTARRWTCARPRRPSSTGPIARRPPMFMATLGLFDVPFGYELVESPRTRLFMERTTHVARHVPGRAGSRAAPRRRARASSAGRSPRTNGEPLGEASPFVAAGSERREGRLLSLRCRHHAAARSPRRRRTCRRFAGRGSTPARRPPGPSAAVARPERGRRRPVVRADRRRRRRARRRRRTSIAGRWARTCA